jgi:hypothetical protein
MKICLLQILQLITKPRIIHSPSNTGKGEIMNRILEKPIPQVEWERDILRLRLNDYIAKRDALQKFIERDEQKLKEIELQMGANIIYLNPTLYKKRL